MNCSRKARLRMENICEYEDEIVLKIRTTYMKGKMKDRYRTLSIMCIAEEWVLLMNASKLSLLMPTIALLLQKMLVLIIRDSH